jgi:integrase
MSRSRKPARLWLRPGSTDREAIWIILDGRQYSTGCGQYDRGQAEQALAKHIAKRFLEKPTEKHRAASEVSVAEVIAHYLLVKEDGARRPKELAARAKALLAYWGDKTLDDITTSTCAAYGKQRSSLTMARRELEDLRAACRMAIADNVTRQAVTVTLPTKPKGRIRHLERSHMAKLIWAAYRKREMQRGVATRKKATLHVARFLITSLYTGSRSSRVWQASFTRQAGRPYVDLEAGVYYRAAEDEDVAANKQAPPVRLPGRLLAHLRRWHRLGAKYVVEYHGRPADPKRAFRNLVDDVLGDDGKGIVRHTMRHTATTWLMQAGVDMWQAAGYLGMTKETLEKTYGHHHPDHQGDVGDAFTSGRAGRVRQ